MLSSDKRALIIVHSSASDPGRVGAALQRRGFQLDRRCREKGDPLPSAMEAHDIAVIFGGPMSANDKSDFIAAETRWMEKALKSGKPLLGICLGAQIMTRALGASVSFHPQRRVEAGFYPIWATGEGETLFPKRFHVYQWHQEGCDLPKGATLLAKGRDFPVQAFRYGESVYGLQFHPELTLATMRRWLKRGAERLRERGARSKMRHFLGHALYDRALQRWMEGFLDNWIASSPIYNGGAAAERKERNHDSHHDQQP